MIKELCKFFLIIIFVLSLSYFSAVIWKDKPEVLNIPDKLIITDNMSISDISIKNKISEQVVLEALKGNSGSVKFYELQIDKEKAVQLIKKYIALEQEHQSKNWFKIRLKFVFWIIFMIIIFKLIKNGKINNRNRNIIYILGFTIFGVVLGSDPSPMGTVKDAIVLFGKENVVFLPRLAALTVFLIVTVIANKFICSWACQLGLFQDYVFRIGKQKKIRKYKVPFIISNSIRTLVFAAICAGAFFLKVDIVEHIDAFKIFKPQMIGTIGGIVIGLIIVSSFFIYRPWCHFLCPFGLVGWFAEKISIFKIKVDYRKCISCEACIQECPSDVMEAILKRQKILPDCFSCGSCIEKCPVNAISFDKGKRELPPENKFKKQD